MDVERREETDVVAGVPVSQRGDDGDDSVCLITGKSQTSYTATMSRKKAPITTPDEQNAAPTQDQIALRAYELYEARGRSDGSALDDWLRAEQEFANPNKSDSK
jgi:hypothetical protein